MAQRIISLYFLLVFFTLLVVIGKLYRTSPEVYNPVSVSPVMTGNTTSIDLDYTNASVSSENMNSLYSESYYAFDDQSNETYWQSGDINGNTGSLILDFGQDVDLPEVISYGLKAVSNQAGGKSGVFKLLGSMDKITWEDLHIQKKGANEEFILSEPVRYRYYKLDIRGNNSSSGEGLLKIRDFYLLGYR